MEKITEETQPNEAIAASETSKKPAKGSSASPRLELGTRAGGKKKKRFSGKFLIIFIAVLTVVIIVGGVVAYANKDQLMNLIAKKGPKTEQTVAQNKYAEFQAEVYDTIMQNYWNKITDEELFNLYQLGTEKIQKETITEIQIPDVIASKDKAGLKAMVTAITDKLDDAKKKDYSVNLAAIVLANLQPFGRSSLYTTKKQQDLNNQVMNIDPTTNLYDVLGVTKEATPEEIAKTAEEKAAELDKIAKDQAQTEEARKQAEQELAMVDRAKQTLAAPETKQNYDQAGVEATVMSELVKPDVFYIKIKQLSPITLDEFQKAIDKIDKESDANLDNLIIDLRGNIGGSVDILPSFLGPFFGNNQYAYDWYQKGEYLPFRTTADALASLARYKRTIVLTDGGTQSSAEVMTASFKRFNKAFVVGTKTKGWGTIERVFDLKTQIDPNETYSVFMVHHITLRDDNQPIEGRGVDPLVNTDDKDWATKLNSYYNYQTLTKAVEEVWEEKK